MVIAPKSGETLENLSVNVLQRLGNEKEPYRNRYVRLFLTDGHAHIHIFKFTI